MDFDVDAFIKAMIEKDKDQQFLALSTLYNTKLTEREKKCLFEKVQDFYIETKRESPHYPTAVFLSGMVHASPICSKYNMEHALLLLREAVEWRHPAAMHLLAKIYLSNFPSYKKQAITLLDSSIEAGNPLAMFVRAELCEQEKNYAAAIYYYDLAIDLGDSNAMNNRAELYESGKGSAPDVLAAIELYKRAIELGNMSAMENLALVYTQNESHLNFAEAIRLNECAIARGSVCALNNLAFMKEKGEGCMPDHNAAMALYDKAIDRGSVGAMYNKGKACEDAGDFAAAISLYDSGIKLNDTNCIMERAELHINGRGCAVNYQAADELYVKAYQLGEREGIPFRVLGKIHECDAKYQKAASLYDKAIEQSDTIAMVRRASMHLNGRAGPINYPAAIQLYQMAIDLGDSAAMVQRAALYESGYPGAKVNLNMAKALYDKAIAQGNKTAMARRSKLYQQMPGIQHQIRFRVLDILVNSADYIRKGRRENLGMFNTLNYDNNSEVDISSYYPLAIALQFLNTLPSLPAVEVLKGRIDKCIGTRIIGKHPILHNFYEQFSDADPGTIDGFMYLVSQYAKRHYTEEGRRIVAAAFSYQAFAASKDPKALHLLKTLAMKYPKVDYWVAVAYLNREQSRGFFANSNRQEAIKWFIKATKMRNPDEETRKLAREQLRQMGIQCAEPDNLVTVEVLPPSTVYPPALQNAAVDLCVKKQDHRADLSQKEKVNWVSLYPTVPLQEPSEEGSKSDVGLLSAAI